VKNGEFIYLVLYVDDMLISSKDEIKLRILKSLLDRKFEMNGMSTTKRHI